MKNKRITNKMSTKRSMLNFKVTKALNQIPNKQSYNFQVLKKLNMTVELQLIAETLETKYSIQWLSNKNLQKSIGILAQRVMKFLSVKSNLIRVPRKQNCLLSKSKQRTKQPENSKVFKITNRSHYKFYKHKARLALIFKQRN